MSENFNIKQVAYEIMQGHRLQPGVSFGAGISALPPGWLRLVRHEIAERKAGRGLPTYREFVRAEKAKSESFRLW